MRMAILVILGAAMLTVAASVSAQPAAPAAPLAQKGFLILGVGQPLGSQSATSTSSVPLYDETGTLTTTPLDLQGALPAPTMRLPRAIL